MSLVALHSLTELYKFPFENISLKTMIPAPYLKFYSRLVNRYSAFLEHNSNKNKHAKLGRKYVWDVSVRIACETCA